MIQIFSTQVQLPVFKITSFLGPLSECFKVGIMKVIRNSQHQIIPEGVNPHDVCIINASDDTEPCLSTRWEKSLTAPTNKKNEIQEEFHGLAIKLCTILQ